MYESRFSDNDVSKRDVPSFIEPRPPLISNPFMRPRPQKGTNLLELFEDDSECEEPELVQVYLRLKPCNIPSNLYEVRSERCLITSLDTTTAGHGRRTQHNVSKMYTFSHIFGPEASQKEIFENVVKDNLRKLPDGHSFTLLTYGASGSGKTYTLMGTVASPGLVPRSLEYVFRVVEAAQQPLYKPSEGGADKLNYAEQDYELQWVKRLRQVSAPLREKYRRMSARLCGDMTASTIDLSNRTRYYVWVSFVEIYNEGIYDLLAPGERRNASKLLIREDSNGNVYVKGATQAFVRTGEEAYDVMVAGKHNLQVAATGVHAQSSRSHCIFTITMLTHTEEGVRASCVRLCDLAGCERQRRTRNTGARMQESRAINSSLHVLERCLHTLRRKQRATKSALVPYRESKLTRLLGAGLSGARGEAVSMVVTLNPSPEYAHETRHVLQLAAVARDIQINNTISEYPSTLESSQDTTLSISTDILKLRAENERLHFELIQAQSRNKELTAAMEERQAASADTMREVAEEAKDITRQYYEAQLQALRDEMEEIVEEYESRLSKVAAPPPPNETPSKALQNKITQLMTEIAILEEKLNAEKLARARAEEEVQHLRACIEERDEKLEENTSINDDVTSLTDSDNESDVKEDPCNESLEPTFTKEDINRSRLIRQSLIEQRSSQDSDQSGENSVLVYSILEKSDDSVLEKSTDTIKDNDKSKHSLDETYATGNESESRKNVGETDIRRLTMTESVETVDNDSLMTAVSKSESRKNFDETSIKRLTLTDSVDKDDNDSLMKDVSKVDEKESYFEDANETNTIFAKNDVNENDKKTYFNDNLELKPHSVISSMKICRGTYFVPEPKFEIPAKESIDDDTFPVKNEIRKTKDSDAHYETIMQDNDSLPLESNNNITGKSLKSQESMDAFDTNSEITIPKGKEKVDDDVQWEIPRKASETLVSKIIKSLKSSTNSNSSLAQFEQLEQATKNHKSEPKEVIETFSNIKILKEKRNYFDDAIKESARETAKPMERKTYFDNISANIKVLDKRLTEVSNEIKDDLRSPSIVKEDVTKDFEPSTIKKLLGESFTRQPDPIQTIVNKSIIKKQESIDVFDSPQTSVTTPFQHEHKVTKSTYDNVPITLPELYIPKHIPELNVIRPSLDGEAILGNAAQEQNVTSKKSPTKDGRCVKTLQEQKTDFNKSPIKNEKPIIKSPKQEKQSIAVSDQSFINNNTMEEFENIYKSITTPRATEFESLVTQEITDTQFKKTQEVVTQENIKYNLRHKSRSKSEKNETKSKNVDEEVLLEIQSESESKPTKRRNLRLRRRKNMTDEETEENDRKEEKLKDIRNLQNEFSDVTIDVPAPVKEVKDIASPEKVESESENMPPLGIQSCPLRSVTRSRRKLFTPRAEPLDESVPGDSNERVCVPRPSYHRPRARRKL